MASRFWTFAANLVSGALARAEHVNAKFTEIDGALLLIANELNRCVRFTAGSVPEETDFQIAQTPAQRANQLVGFDESGNVETRSVSFVWRSDWAVGATYAINDAVKAPAANFGSLYVCTVAHVSTNSFDDDLADGNWSLMVDLEQVDRSVRQFEMISGTVTAEAGDDLMVDTTDQSVSITLPSDPSIDDQPITIAHVKGNASSNPVTIDRNGELINGVASNLTISTSGASVQLAYTGDATVGWRTIASHTPA